MKDKMNKYDKETIDLDEEKSKYTQLTTSVQAESAELHAKVKKAEQERNSTRKTLEKLNKEFSTLFQSS